MSKTKGRQNQGENLCLKYRELKTFRVHCLGYIINGYLKILDNYTRIYPLKNGRLLATTEERAGNMFYSGTYLHRGSITGEIIDEEGKVIFSDERYLRYIIADVNRLIVLLAKPGFDGLTLDVGIIDSDGNWIKELNSDNQISKALKGYVDYENDNTWNFENGRYSTVIINRENKIVQILNRKSVSILYNAETDEIENSEYIDDVSARFSNNTIAYYNGETSSYDLCDLIGNVVDNFKGSLIKGDYFYNKQEGKIKNIVNGSTIDLSETVLNHLVKIYTNDVDFFTVLKGEDKQYYIVKISSTGIAEEESSFLKYYDGEGSILFFEDFMVYTARHEEKVYIADLNNYNIVHEIEPHITAYSGTPDFGLYKLDSTTFFISSHYEDNEFEYAVCNLSGEELY